MLTKAVSGQVLITWLDYFKLVRFDFLPLAGFLIKTFNSFFFSISELIKAASSLRESKSRLSHAITS